MTRYLIDIRQMGPVKHQIRTLSNHLEEKFNLVDKQVIPHITLAGPFSTDDEEKLIKDFTRICSSQTKIPEYEVGGYGFFRDSRVVFVTITPDEFSFHSTLAMKLDWLTFQRIKWYFRKQETIRHRHHPIRATLLRNSRI